MFVYSYESGEILRMHTAALLSPVMRCTISYGLNHFVFTHYTQTHYSRISTRYTQANSDIYPILTDLTSTPVAFKRVKTNIIRDTLLCSNTAFIQQFSNDSIINIGYARGIFSPPFMESIT